MPLKQIFVLTDGVNPIGFIDSIEFTRLNQNGKLSEEIENAAWSYFDAISNKYLFLYKLKNLKTLD